MAMPEPNLETPGWHGYTCFVREVYCVRGNRFDQQTSEEGLLIAGEAASLTNERLESRTTQGLRSAMSTGHRAATVELALRIYTGTRGPKKDVSKGLEMWQELTRLRVTSSAPGSAAVRDAQADAYLLLCAHHMRLYELNKSIVPLASAVEAAAKAATLGKYRTCSWRTAMEWQAFLSSANVNKGKKAKRDGRIKIEIRSDEEEAAWAKAGTVLSDNNNAFERITEKHLDDNRARAVERERSAPSAHHCSRPECSAMTTSLSGFWRCAGRCSGNNQAHYCAKECQVQDWSRHRQVCKRAKEKIVTVRDPTSDTTVEIDTSNLKTSQAETLRIWSEVSTSNDIPGPIQEHLQRMARESSVKFNKEQILQVITDWF